MNLNEIKKTLYKEKPTAKRTADFESKAYYKCNTSNGEVYFVVPKNEMGEKEFNAEEPAQLLIRWISTN